MSPVPPIWGHQHMNYFSETRILNAVKDFFIKVKHVFRAEILL